MNKLSRRDVIIATAACAVTPLSAMRLSAAELKVDLSDERVGQPPTTFQRSSAHGGWFRTGPTKSSWWMVNRGRRTRIIVQL
jgi:hypothetical protein